MFSVVESVARVQIGCRGQVRVEFWGAGNDFRLVFDVMIVKLGVYL
jgi:hypothetical protein